MSKRTQMIAVRVPNLLVMEILASIATYNARHPGKPWTRTEWLLSAIQEKLAKMQRGRKASASRRRPLAVDLADEGEQLADEVGQGGGRTALLE